MSGFQKATSGAAAYDVRAGHGATIPVRGQVIIGTGIKAEIPDGWYLEIVSRSGLVARNRIAVANAPGIIDADYKGEIKVILRNDGDKPFRVRRGDRIAQAQPKRVEQVDWPWLVDAENTAERGDGGLGSTGLE